MYKLFIILLFGISISIAQISNRNSNSTNIVASDSLVDILPLAVGNQWIYNYKWTYSSGGPWGSYKDTGTVIMQIINKDSKIDSTIWSVQEIFNIWIQNDSSAFNGPTRSIDTIRIVELGKGQHRIYSLDRSKYYNSVFPFPRVADTVVYRYDVVNTFGVRTFTSNGSIFPERYIFNFQQCVGLTSIVIIDMCTCMDSYNGTHSLRSQSLTNVSDHQRELVDRNYQLFQNYPNPFNPTTTISFFVPSRSFVSLKILDCLGRETVMLVAENLSSGYYSHNWSAINLPSGVYFYRLQAGLYTETKKLILLK
jgi:hypothetical protein